MFWLIALPVLTLLVMLPVAHWIARPRRKPLPPPEHGRVRVVVRDETFTGRGLYEP